MIGAFTEGASDVGDSEIIKEKDSKFEGDDNVHNNWLVFQLDINNGFLYGDLVEDVYMSLLYGYSDKNDTRVCKLVKSLYGLKQAPRKWNEKLTSVLLDNEFKQNSDWAKSKIIRKSITGFAVFVGKNLVSWKSKKQSMLSKSSTKAEYRAMNSVTCEVIWIIKILAELNIDTSLHVPFHCDNDSAIQIAANPIFHERTKQFEIELFFLREKISNGIVRTVKVKFADNTANIFTKGLSVQDHNKFCENLGMYDLYKMWKS
ncbi:ribonuclease H-like domain-containing protein [Tanacetum coccineum]